MLLSIYRYIKGYLKIRVIGYSPERFLNACSHRGIYIWGITPACGSYDMYITISGFHKLKPIIRKTGAKVVVTERIGIPFYLFRYRKRKVFFAGAALSVAFIYFLSLFVWSIDVKGNRKYTDEALIAFLEERGVEHGMRLSKVDCDRIVKDIRKSYDEIIWVSASIEGCRLIVQIKENEDSKDVTSTAENTQTMPENNDTESRTSKTSQVNGRIAAQNPETAQEDGETAAQNPETAQEGEETEAQNPEASQENAGAESQNPKETQNNGEAAQQAGVQGMDIVADCDGVITTMIVRKGVPCVTEGQQVHKGDILVTGAVPVVNDAGETTGYQFHQSEADIRAQVLMDYQESCDLSYESKEYIHQEKEELYLQIGEHIFWLGSHGNRFPNAEELTIQNRLRIGKHFYLPVSWGKKVTLPYKSTQVKYSENKLQSILSEEYSRFTDNLTKKGVEIIENDVKIYTGPKQAEAKGTLTVIKDIGTERPTSIVEDVADGDD